MFNNVTYAIYLEILAINSFKRLEMTLCGHPRSSVSTRLNTGHTRCY